MFSERLKSLRIKRGISQDQLAKELNIPRPSITNYENNESRLPRQDRINKIADYFGVSIDYLLGRSDNPSLDKNGLPELTKKDKIDIAKDLEGIINNLNSKDALAFNGEPMDDETRRLVAEAIESNLKMAKQLAKKKFTSKKYRKWE